jgi:hypothetical protein
MVVAVVRVAVVVILAQLPLQVVLLVQPHKDMQVVLAVTQVVVEQLAVAVVEQVQLVAVFQVVHLEVVAQE